MKKFLSIKNIIIASCFLVGIVGIGLWQYTFWRNLFWNDLYNQTLAGEAVPFDTAHQFNYERFDRELAVTRLDEAQVEINRRRFGLYKTMIEKKLREANIPLDIFYVAVAESSLRETAVSTAGAAWLWQFMPATAKSYGLRVDNEIDERYNVEKSTDAAIQYLKVAYEKFWNRTLAIASYNRWMNGIANDMNSQYQSSFYDLWLNNETSRYIFRIIAAKEIYNHLNRYFDTSKWGAQYKNPETITVQVEQTDNLAAWAASMGYSYAEIRYLNPWVRSNKLPTGTWNLKVYKR